MIGDVIVLTGFIALILMIIFLVISLIPKPPAPAPIALIFSQGMVTITPLFSSGSAYIIYVTSMRNITVTIVQEGPFFMNYTYVKLPSLLEIVIAPPWSRPRTVVIWPTGCIYWPRTSIYVQEVLVPSLFENYTLVLYPDGTCRPAGTPVTFIPYTSLVRRGDMFGIVTISRG